MKIEEKLHNLSECGLKLGDQFGVSNLVASWGREALDKPGYDLALVCLGMTQEEPPWKPHCVNLWHFDTECIEGDGSYIRIAKRMEELAQGSIPLTDLKDHVDIEKGNAWLSFTCFGQPVKVKFSVQNDWVDTTVFRHFIDLLARHDPRKVFLYYDLKGQDCIIGCVTREQFSKLTKLLPQVKPLT